MAFTQLIELTVPPRSAHGQSVIPTHRFNIQTP
jgi:hypothetical protein